MQISLTDEAAEALSEQLQRSPLAHGAGLRIWSIPLDSGPQLACAFVEGPTPADVVLDEGGVRIFLDSEVAPVLENKTIGLAAEGDARTFIVIDEWRADGDVSLG